MIDVENHPNKKCSYSQYRKTLIQNKKLLSVIKEEDPAIRLYSESSSKYLEVLKTSNIPCKENKYAKLKRLSSQAEL
jgi:hypothetical protein